MIGEAPETLTSEHNSRCPMFVTRANPGPVGNALPLGDSAQARAKAGAGRTGVEGTTLVHAAAQQLTGISVVVADLLTASALSLR